MMIGDPSLQLATKYGASTFQLSHVNPLSIDEACEQLQIGSELCLGFEGSDCSKIHTVVEGDTCGLLLDVYGMDDATLRQNNPQINEECTNIYIGEVLCVDTQAYEYPEFDQEKFEVSTKPRPLGREEFSRCVLWHRAARAEYKLTPRSSRRRTFPSATRLLRSPPKPAQAQLGWPSCEERISSKLLLIP